MRSHLLEGTVRHQRTQPFTYALRHRVYAVAVDLAELDQLDRHFRLLGRRRRKPLMLRDRDHLPGGSHDLAADMRAHLARTGIDPTGWSIVLVANLRVFGYVFDPASFFLCRDETGRLQVVVVEVHNTFGERHLYTLRPEPNARADADRGRSDRHSLRASMAKDFYVSPFISLDGRYRVTIHDDTDGLRIGIDLRQHERPLLATSLILERRPLTDRMLVSMLVRHPLMTQRTIALIHWHALRLRLKGARFHRHAGWAERLASSRKEGATR